MLVMLKHDCQKCAVAWEIHEEVECWQKSWYVFLFMEYAFKEGVLDRKALSYFKAVQEKLKLELQCVESLSSG